ncbi:MAG: response regulator [SAR324 cluster bacterium]|nr:response regulator [SAR324 cluster bacterium]
MADWNKTAETREFNTPKESILIVDDAKVVVKLLTSILEPSGYACTMAYNASEAWSRMQERPYDLLLADVNMPPGETGLALLQRVRKVYPDTATIIITAIDSHETGNAALEMGAYGYMIKPFDKNELLINVANALIRRRLSQENRDHKAKLEQEVLGRTNELMISIQRLERMDRQLRLSQEETVYRLAKAGEFRDNETARHVQRMSRYCELIAQQLGLEEERCELIRTASPLHDIGKIGTHDRILLKPGKLTGEEFEIMKEHAEIGYQILTGSESDLLNMGATIAWTHHEKYDGAGYPRGITGEDIPLEGRLTAVADVFDALTSKRVYKPAFEMTDAVNFMHQQKGAHFDPELVDVFLDSMPDVLRIKEQYGDE